MSNNFYEKKKEKLINYQRLAKQAAAKAEAYHKKADYIGNYIPMGQPILIGHHSEKRHRKDLERIDNYTKKSIEENSKAQYYHEKIANIENDKIISSDDPEAILKLEEKLRERIEYQESMKQINKKARQEKKAPPYESYQLRNNYQNIIFIKNRIKTLKEKKSDVSKIIYEDNNIKIWDNVEKNRLQIYFQNIPDRLLREKLKNNGFHWSPTNQCWQRMRFKSINDIIKKIFDL